MTKRAFYTVLCCLVCAACFAQTDTTKRPVPVDTLVKNAPPLSNKAKADSLRKKFSPRKATIRSALIPGWGQAYNKKYWKIPLVYGALGTTAAVFIYNLKTYRELRFAYQAKYKAALPAYDPTKPGPFRDSTDYWLIKPIYLNYDANSLRLYRDEFRSNIDYSVLFFLVFWGLNVVDATVDAHLKLFDVNPDLSFKLKFGPSQMAGTTGLSFILAFNKKRNHTN
ncbi:DUF5683 domain-containing protein [Flavisolibacter nicotianae]|uniref:DUF5683 domain-containing protein n=1 Tax=Flavisolibacter nicotianae TaxID=2364882 RepID=UPI000EB2B189|nr:DUF5683 domain-containing protein [Flavisolibacter nicotianae]